MVVGERQVQVALARQEGPVVLDGKGYLLFEDRADLLLLSLAQHMPQIPQRQRQVQQQPAQRRMPCARAFEQRLAVDPRAVVLGIS